MLLTPPITAADVVEASQRLTGLVRRTPLLPWDLGRPPSHARLYLKLEQLQVTGSFKPRGALNAITSLHASQLRNGVVTASGGNHGLAVAYAAQQRGVPATVYLPQRASTAIDAKLESYGATVVREGPDWDDAWEAASRFARETGAATIHPFEDPPVMAGQGTLGVELLEQEPDLDTLVIAIGGGGLIGGISTYVTSVKPEIRVVGVEPVGARSMQVSLEAGRVVPLDEVRTIAGTLAPRSVGPHSLAAAQHYVDQIVNVSDGEMVEAMRLLWSDWNLLVEPAGAAALAAVMTERVALEAGSRVGVLLCGANLDVSAVWPTAST
jgi:threonine dehydratase